MRAKRWARIKSKQPQGDVAGVAHCVLEGPLVRSKRGAQSVGECGRWSRQGRTRHLSCGDAVMNLDPGREVIRVAGLVVQLADVESCGRRGAAVASRSSSE